MIVLLLTVTGLKSVEVSLSIDTARVFCFRSSAL
jgi:hypothetical protein